MESNNSLWLYALGALVLVLLLAALYLHHRSDGIGSTAYDDISSNLLAQTQRDAERESMREYESYSRERERGRDSNRDNASGWSRGNSNSRDAYGKSIETARDGSCNDCSYVGRNSSGQAVFSDVRNYYTGNVQGQRRDGGSGSGSGFPRGLCTFADFGKFSWRDYIAGCGCYEHKTNAGDGTKDTDIRCRCDQCEVCNYCGDCAKGSAAPPVRADFGNPCTSSANLCGATNQGTIECDGCTATTPALPSDYYSFHTSSPNVCGDTNEVQIQCGNRATTPPNTQCTATVDDLSVDPTIVRKDDTTEITWSCTYADYAVLYNITNGDRFILTDGTTLTAPNGETYTALGGTVTSGPIISESDYILECHGEFSNSTTTASTTIRIIPRFDEN